MYASKLALSSPLSIGSPSRDASPQLSANSFLILVSWTCDELAGILDGRVHFRIALIYGQIRLSYYFSWPVSYSTCL